MIRTIVNVSSIEQLNDAYFVITVDLQINDFIVQPGQFFHIRIPDVLFPILRRPFSIYDWKNNRLSFMIKKRGKTTDLLSHVKVNNKLDIIGPLGKGFPIINDNKAVLISGGIGYPPLHFLKKRLEKAQNHIYWLHGGQNNQDVFLADEIWTNDGSVGNKGFVTEGLKQYLEKNNPSIIYACGPNSMLKTCVKIASEYQIPLYVSLEEYIACGIGVCHGCAVKTLADNPQGYCYKNVCNEGPVFRSDEICW